MSLYGWVWRHLPGPVPVKLVLAVVLLLGVAAICGQWLYPWVAGVLEGDGGLVAGT